MHRLAHWLGLNLGRVVSALDRRGTVWIGFKCAECGRSGGIDRRCHDGSPGDGGRIWKRGDQDRRIGGRDQVRADLICRDVSVVALPPEIKAELDAAYDALNDRVQEMLDHEIEPRAIIGAMGRLYVQMMNQELSPGERQVMLEHISKVLKGHSQ